MTDTPTFRTTRPRRRGEVADPVRDLADYDRVLAGVPSDYPGLPLMRQRRDELAAIADAPGGIVSETCVCGTQVVRMSTERMADGSFRVTTLPVAVFPAANVHVVEDGTEGTGLYESRQTSGHANRAGHIDLRTSGSPYTVEELTWSEHTADRCAAIVRDRETT